MNPLLAKVKLPGRVFQLPSKGVFYLKGVLAADVHEGEVQVKAMSALAEMKLRSADLLISAKVLNELCQECIPEILQPDLLVAQDVDAIFAFLRVATYGSTHRVNSIHGCEKAKVHTYEVDLESILSKPNNKIIEHHDTLYRVALSNGQIVHTKPNTYSEAMKVLYIQQEIAKKEALDEEVDDKLREKVAVMDLMCVIFAVEDNGEVIDDREMVEEWLRAITKPMLNEIVASVSKTGKWGYDFSAKLKCKDCGETYDHELELDPITFFFG